MDELSKLTNGVVYGLEKRITKPPISQTKADLWEILKALAPPDCPSMQADINSTKSFRMIKFWRIKSIAEMQKTGTPKVLFFQTHQKKRSQSLMVSLLPKNKKQIPVLQIYLVRCVLFWNALQTSKWPRPKNSRMQWSAFMFRFGKRIIWKTTKKCTWKISDLERQLHYFE